MAPQGWHRGATTLLSLFATWNPVWPAPNRSGTQKAPENICVCLEHGVRTQKCPSRCSVLVSPHSKKPGEDPAALAPLFGPPLESAFEEHKLDGEFGVRGGWIWGSW